MSKGAVRFCISSFASESGRVLLSDRGEIWPMRPYIPRRESHVIRILPLFFIGFKVWMLVDAIRRREPYYWLLIIAFIPFGAWIYFFLVKVKDYDLEAVRERFRRPPSVATLRTDFEASPSLARRVDLGEGLLREGGFAEAAQLFGDVLENEDDNKEAMFGLGRARIGLEDYDAATRPLSRLVDMDRTYMDHEAWIHLAHALCMGGHESEGLESLARLVRSNPRLRHQVCFASYLIEAGRAVEARDVLTQAVEDHKRSPRFLKRQNFRLGLTARRMLRKVGATATV